MSEPKPTQVVEEPVLPLGDIQGIAVPGFFKPHQTLIGASLPNDPSVINFKRLLHELIPAISTGAQTLNDRREHRRARSEGQSDANARNSPVLMAMGFTHDGLTKLTPGVYAIPSEAFRRGLAARSALLGDPCDAREEGHPTQWKVGNPSSPGLDLLVVVAANGRSSLDARTQQLKKALIDCDLKILYSENGDIRTDLEGHEHFGFDDGVSQPGIRGRASDDPDDFITPRQISLTRYPEVDLYGWPGQDLVWPGEFVLGQPATSPDPLMGGIVAPAIPGWTQNGSFLVFRRLRQDVGLFWRTMREKVKELQNIPGFTDITEERLASLIVGRWPSGAPVNRVPHADSKNLGKEPLANNHFRFDSDAARLPLRSGFQDPYPMSKADPAGTICPWAAHIRKVNTRDSASDMGGRDSTYTRRLLRVGVPFGEPLKDVYSTKEADPLHGERGLLFLGIQSSIEEQFEFLMSRWMGDASRPKSPAGHDILVGQNDTPGERRQRRCVLFGEAAQQVKFETDAQWIVPTGGGYFFLPSITALREVLAAD